MRINTLNPLHFILPTAFITPVKVILSLLLLVYGAFNFSLHHWIFIGMIVVAIMAVSERISSLNTTHKTNQRVIHTDGGSFSQVEKSNQAHGGRPIVQDGGLFNNKDWK